MCFSCSNKFQLFMGHAEARLAMQRLGLLLAAVASLSGAAACQAFAGQCVGMISGGEGGQHHVSGGRACGRRHRQQECQHIAAPALCLLQQHTCRSSCCRVVQAQRSQSQLKKAVVR